MNPNAFLRTFWRTELRPEVFVAMDFGVLYDYRFEQIIAPAVRSVSLGGVSLRPRRVDISKTGDSILTDILDGVAHCQLVLADVSTIGHDSKTGHPFRNANVLYEVGLALACRQPSEVLLIRDDRDRFLFDVSTVPHRFIDFTDAPKARAEIASEVVARLHERDVLHDARLEVAIASLTAEELKAIKAFARYAPGQVFWAKEINIATIAAMPRLLDKQLLRAVATVDQSNVAYTWTTLGHAVAALIDVKFPNLPTPEVASLPASTRLQPDSIPPFSPASEHGT
jgi:hypothetical protein